MKFLLGLVFYTATFAIGLRNFGGLAATSAGQGWAEPAGFAWPWLALILLAVGVSLFARSLGEFSD